VHFCSRRSRVLGALHSGKGISTEKSKVLAVEQWPQPVNVKELRGFLGLTSYYRKFIKYYGLISKTLT